MSVGWTVRDERVIILAKCSAVYILLRAILAQHIRRIYAKVWVNSACKCQVKDGTMTVERQ